MKIMENNDRDEDRCVLESHFPGEKHERRTDSTVLVLLRRSVEPVEKSGCERIGAQCKAKRLSEPCLGQLRN